MSLYKWIDNTLQIYNNGQTTDIVFPEKTHGIPVCSQDGRYTAVSAANNIYVHDCSNNSFITMAYQSKNVRRDLRFDRNNKIYYIDGNNIGYMDFNNGEDILLYNVGRKHCGPQNLGVSPDGKYITFCRYRANNLYLFLYDTTMGECKDYKVSLHHYAWLNEKYIIWSKGGGLKLLDVDTGKRRVLVRDHRTLSKKCNKEDAQRLEKFKSKDKLDLFVDLDLLGVLENKIYFSLAIHDFNGNREDAQAEHTEFKHYGIWTVDIDGANACFCYTFPDDFRKANAGYKFLTRRGDIAWNRNQIWNIFDGTTTDTCSSEWMPVIFFDSVNK